MLFNTIYNHYSIHLNVNIQSCSVLCILIKMHFFFTYLLIRFKITMKAFVEI